MNLEAIHLPGPLDWLRQLIIEVQLEQQYMVVCSECPRYDDEYIARPLIEGEPLIAIGKWRYLRDALEQIPNHDVSHKPKFIKFA